MASQFLGGMANPFNDPICPGCIQELPIDTPFCACGRKNDDFNEEEFERQVGGTYAEQLEECRREDGHEWAKELIEKDLLIKETIPKGLHCQWCGIPLPPLD